MRPPTRRARPRPLIIKALDANGDGVIDASEIANAPAALKTLDKNGDGQLTRDEYLGKRPGPPPHDGNAVMMPVARRPTARRKVHRRMTIEIRGNGQPMAAGWKQSAANFLDQGKIIFWFRPQHHPGKAISTRTDR